MKWRQGSEMEQDLQGWLEEVSDWSLKGETMASWRLFEKGVGAQRWVTDHVGPRAESFGRNLKQG